MHYARKSGREEQKGKKMKVEVFGELSWGHVLSLDGMERGRKIFYRSNVCTQCGGYCDGQRVVCTILSDDDGGGAPVHVYSLRHRDLADCANPNTPGTGYDSVEGALGGEERS